MPVSIRFSEHLQVEASRRILRSVLVGERYFSNEAREVLLQQGFVNREAFIYSEKLLENPRDLQIRETLPLEEEYIPVRDQGFRRAVVTAYCHRCALCAIRVRTSTIILLSRRRTSGREARRRTTGRQMVWHCAGCVTGPSMKGCSGSRRSTKLSLLDNLPS